MRDHRGRTIQYQDGKRIKHLPKNNIVDCFETQVVSYWVKYSNLKGNEYELLFLSGHNERDFRKENKELFIFN